MCLGKSINIVSYLLPSLFKFYKVVTKYLLKLLPSYILRVEILGNNFMNDLAKGGRGKKAPYDSTHYRLPVPLKPLCEELAANYRELVTQYLDPNSPELITAVLAASGGSANNKSEELAIDCIKQAETINQLEAKINQLLQENEELNSRQSNTKIKTILNEALELKANAGGAIKVKIRQALEML